jgi:hypothetical protein
MINHYSESIPSAISLCESSKGDVKMIRADKSELKMSDYYSELKLKKSNGELSDIESKRLKKLKEIFS